MAPTKRPAAFAAGALKKKRADPVATKCAEVAAELGKANSLPRACRDMLAAVIKDCLKVYAAERHPFQVQTVDMAAQTMAATKSKLEDGVAKAQVFVDSADVEKASRTAAAAAAATKLTELEAAVKGAEEVLKTSKAAEAASKVSLADADKAITDNDFKLSSAEGLKGKLESAKEVFGSLKTSKSTSHKDLSHLVKVLKECMCDADLTNSLSAAFTKEADARTTFDNIVVNELETQIAKQLKDFEFTIKNGESIKLQAANTKTSAEATLTAASEKLTASKAALVDAKAAVTEAKKTLASAKVAVESYDKDMKAATVTLADAKSALASFVEGPLKAFGDLKDLAPPPPEPAAEAKEATPAV